MGLSLFPDEHAVRDNSVADQVDNHSEIVVVPLEQGLIDLEVSEPSLEHVLKIFDREWVLLSASVNFSEVLDPLLLILSEVRILKRDSFLHLFLGDLLRDVVLYLVFQNVHLLNFVAQLFDLRGVEALDWAFQVAH